MASNGQSTGFFITFEGGEGVGKSTQMALLEDRLKEAGHQVVTSREPGGTPHAEEIREIILSGAAEKLGPEYEAMLFAAARLDHAETLIAPALQEGKIVICDRYADSTRVYQGADDKVSEETISALDLLVKDFAWPNLTIVLDVDPETGMARATKRRSDEEIADRFEKQDITVQAKRRKAFLDIAGNEPDRCVVVPADEAPELVHEKVWAIVEPRLPGGSG